MNVAEYYAKKLNITVPELTSHATFVEQGDEVVVISWNESALGIPQPSPKEIKKILVSKENNVDPKQD